MSKYIIGVDGGGTKTLAVLFDIQGNEIKRVITGFGNFSVNVNDTIKHLLEAIDRLTKEISKSELAIIQIGIAGYSNFTDKDSLTKTLTKRYACKVVITTDAKIALYSIKKDTDNNVIMVLGGTGSAIMYEIQGEVKLIGGFGHILGDEGSSYHLAISALKNIIKQYEEGKAITSLSKKVLAKINAENYSDIKNFVYNNQKTEIAKLAKFIANMADEGDLEAIKLFKDEGKLLAKQTFIAYQAMGVQETVIIGIKGGFLLNAPYVKDTLVSELNKKDISYKLDTSEVEPVVGAYYLAKQNLVKR
ncbi:MAG: N-acetylglucosamine kinase [Bacillota bacterium]